MPPAARAVAMSNSQGLTDGLIADRPAHAAAGRPFRLVSHHALRLSRGTQTSIEVSREGPLASSISRAAREGDAGVRCGHFRVRDPYLRNKAAFPDVTPRVLELGPLASARVNEEDKACVALERPSVILYDRWYIAVRKR